MVIEKDKEICDKLVSQEQLVIHGNANDDDILHTAGLHRAKFLISALPDDSDNLFVVLSARQANPTIQIIAAPVKKPL